MKQEITLNIDGKQVKAYEGDTILNVARANDIFIPAICYLTRCSPTLACRVCLVEADGKRVYSCNAKAKEGMNVVINNDEINEEREAIMQVYDINHPLQCGVCDKSGECELQDNTLFMGVNEQKYAIPDLSRAIFNWGKIKYDGGLCIVCERCITVCKDMIGDAALKTVSRDGSALDASYKDTMPKDAYTMWNKLNKSLVGTASGDATVLDCIECGECISACPVGALVSSDFQYKSNAWELTSVPSACTHCSSTCQLIYDIKHKSTTNTKETIYRVKNDFHFVALCGAGRFGFDYQNELAKKDDKQFARALEAFKNANTIKFTSDITNEEALILQKIKQKTGIKLVNKEASAFKGFIDNYSSVAGGLYSGDLKYLYESDFVVSVGTMITTDNPVVRFGINSAMKNNKAAGLYIHPVKDVVLSGFSKSLLSIANKVGSEEAVMLLLLDIFADKERIPQKTKDYISSFYSKEMVTVKETVKEKQFQKVIEKQKNENGEEVEVEVEKEVMVPVEKEVQKEISKNKLFEITGISSSLLEQLEKLLSKKEQFTLILGEDLINHPRSKNIAKLAGMIEKYSNFKVLIVPPKTNTLGVSLICDLDKEASGYTIGYNTKGDFTLTALGAKGEDELDMPALNQQEGTFTNIDKRVVPINAALGYEGYTLCDIANELGIKAQHTIEYTRQLPREKGYKEIDFDSLENHYTKSGEEKRGYLLNANKTTSSDDIEGIEDIAEYNGTVVYRCNPVLQFNQFTAKCSQLKEEQKLVATKEFLASSGLQEADKALIKINNKEVAMYVELTNKYEGNFAFISNYDEDKLLFDEIDYRFLVANIKKV